MRFLVVVSCVGNYHSLYGLTNQTELQTLREKLVARLSRVLLLCPSLSLSLSHTLCACVIKGISKMPQRMPEGLLELTLLEQASSALFQPLSLSDRPDFGKQTTKANRLSLLKCKIFICVYF